MVLKVNSKDLSEIEMITLNLIKEAGEIQIRNLPDKRMIGAVSNLKNKGFIEIFKKYTSIYKRKKKKFVRAKKP